MRLRAAGILLVLGASALRDEIDRLALQVGENEQLSYQKEASRGISQLEDQQQIAQPFGPTAEAFINEGAVDPTVLESAAPRKVWWVQVPGSNKFRKLPGGLVQLSDRACRRVLKERFVLHADLTAQLTTGDVQIQGNVQFSAAHGLERACLTVEKNANVTGKIRFQNCHNKNEAGEPITCRSWFAR
eukprot:Skav220625  [mRNA]  locus=scaffold112:142325:145836:+ [translate_table: standard]